MGPIGGARGGPRAYGQQLQHRDVYDSSAERGSALNQGPSSSRLVSNTLSVAPSNLPSNSGR